MDSLWALPILLVVYFLIAFVEFKWAVKLQNNRYLRGKASPIVGALVGSVPQCGFSVVATDLFAKGIIPVGALLAVFLATNDEALPLLIAHPQNWLAIVVLIVAKIVVAVVAGYLAGAMYRLLFRRAKPLKVMPLSGEVPHAHHDGESHDEPHDEPHADTVVVYDACCHHHVTDQRFNWWHPCLHSLKIWAFIVAVSFLFGCVAEIWVGTDRLTAFLTSSFWLQPVVAVVVGLIPNCAASVVLSELYLAGGLRFGALLGGLCVNAGLGVIFLLRQKGLGREKLFVVGWLLAVSLLVGYGSLWVTF